MATEREEALRDVNQAAPPENKIPVALSEAEATKQLAMSQKHTLDMRRAELGWVGRLWGGETHAPIVVAFVVILLAFGSAIGLWIAARLSPRPEFWGSEAHIAIGAGMTALGYLFGRSSKEDPK